MVDRNKISNVIIEEFLKTRAEKIRANFPEPPSEPKELEYITLVIQGQMAMFAAKLILSFNSRWN